MFGAPYVDLTSALIACSLSCRKIELHHANEAVQIKNHCTGTAIRIGQWPVWYNMVPYHTNTCTGISELRKNFLPPPFQARIAKLDMNQLN